SLAAANFSDRLVTQREIVHRGERFRPALLQIVATPDYGHDARLLALGALESFWKDDVRRTFIHVLSDADADLVRLAADGLSSNCEYGDFEAHSGLVQVIDHPSAAARRAIALALGRIGAPGVEDYLITAYRNDNGHDVYLTDGIIRALERLGPRGVA